MINPVYAVVLTEFSYSLEQCFRMHGIGIYLKLALKAHWGGLCTLSRPPEQTGSTPVRT